ncbi:hypothetical protein [Rossellomorea aquimaris]|uniref:hypothetical protein n=1 Tax=Rossellomorea aquimaris TaxID=189382 RepID=UPI0011E93333|nr:hypothetical protein [Rossellomorea aquimaris]TYS88968.1 hypothetical protein FZC88_12955 [Rossellomorea aquimaris]
MTDKIFNKDITDVSISLLDDTTAIACGVELIKNGIPYTIMSLYFDKSDYPSKRQTLHYIYSLVFQYVPESDKLISFTSNSPYFGQYKEQERKAGLYADGRKLSFRRVKNVKRHTKLLQFDAAKRKTSIIEKL